MAKIIQLHYSDSMDMVNAIEAIAKVVADYGIEIKILEGGDGYEEIEISKVGEIDMGCSAKNNVC